MYLNIKLSPMHTRVRNEILLDTCRAILTIFYLLLCQITSHSSPCILHPFHCNGFHWVLPLSEMWVSCLLSVKWCVLLKKKKRESRERWGLRAHRWGSPPGRSWRWGWPRATPAALQRPSSAEAQAHVVSTAALVCFLLCFVSVFLFLCLFVIFFFLPHLTPAGCSVKRLPSVRVPQVHSASALHQQLGSLEVAVGCGDVQLKGERRHAVLLIFL